MVAELAVVGGSDLEGFDMAYELGKMTQPAGQVFSVWLAMPERSLADAARLTAANEVVVRQWSSKYGWKQLAARYDESQNAALFGALRGAIVKHSFRAVQFASEVMEGAVPDSKVSDRLKAAAWLASLGGLGPRSAPVGAFGSDGADISGEDLRKLATSGKKEDLERLLKITTGRGQ
jgi:hypothetical protein